MARDITQLHPRLQTIIPKLIEECKEQGVPIKIGECVRTVEEQNDLYAKGRTTAGNIVTYARGTDYQSQHQWGIACDFYLDMDVDGDGIKADDAFNNTQKGFEKVGAIAKSLGLGWGGDWTSPVDRPHLYLPDWGATTTKLKNTYGTPDKFKVTWNEEKSFVHNGVDYSLVFNPTYYTNRYADLKRAFGTNADKLFNHFITYGMKEGRQAISTFNVHAYKKRYADLQRAFKNNLPSYYKHYIQYGKKEKRKAV